MSDEGVKFDTDRLFRELQAGLNGFAQDFPLEQFQQGNFKQYPSITLLACCDSRVPGTMLGPLFNRVFSVESIGNQVKTVEGSVLYGLLHLHTPVMIVSGHSDCGAIKAASGDYSSEPEALKKELEVVKQSVENGLKVLEAELADDEKTRFTQMAELNVDVQIQYLLENPQIRSRVDDRQLVVLGVILDLHNVYAGGYGKSYVCNINGERDLEKLRAFEGVGSMAQQAMRLT